MFSEKFVAIDSLPIAIVCLMCNGLILHVNPHAKELIKSNAEGRNIFNIIPPRYYSFARDVIKSACGIERVINVDGREFFIKSSHSDNSEIYLIVQETTEATAQYENLIRDAYTDTLTKLFNRRKFFLETSKILDPVQPPLYSVLTLDIDHFKKINDTYGHDAGDDILKCISGLCSSLLRQTDIFARFGGEEFTAFLPEADSKAAATIGERMRETIEKTFIKYNGYEINCTISIGVYTPLEHEDLSAALQKCDESLYHAKNSGRNIVCLRVDDDYLFPFKHKEDLHE